MNRKIEISILSKQDANFLYSPPYTLFKVPVTVAGKPEFNFYALPNDYASHPLGEGTSGTVHKIFPINKKTGKILLNEPWAVKVIEQIDREAMESLNEEASDFRRYYKGEKPFVVGNKGFFIMELFPGVDLFLKNSAELDPSLRNLSLGQVLEISQMLLVTMIRIQSNSFSARGIATAHTDLKGQNIKVHIDESGKVRDVNVFDFGAAYRISGGVEQKLDAYLDEGTPFYFPPEVAAGKRGLKSDLWALVAVIIILGGGDAFEDRKKILIDPHDQQKAQKAFAQISKIKYNFTNFFEKYRAEIENLPLDIKALTMAFLERAQDLDYDKRPDAEEWLKFFTSLNSYYKLASLYPNLLAQNMVMGNQGVELKKGFAKELDKLLEVMPAISLQVNQHASVLILASKGLWNANYYQNPAIDIDKFSETVVTLNEKDLVDASTLFMLRNGFTNFKAEIDLLKHHTDNILYKDSFMFFKIQEIVKGKKELRFYAFSNDQHHYLGHGNFATTYKIYPIDAATGDTVLDQPMALKVVEKDVRELSNEAKIFLHYYKGEKPLLVKDRGYFIMELIPGIQLFDNDNQLNPAFQNLSFGETLNLIQTLLTTLIRFHSNSLSARGHATSHADLKGQNIKVHIDRKGRISVYILDFGLSDLISNGPQEQIKVDVKGSPYYMPPEAVSPNKKSSRGLKSDLWSILPIIILLCGGDAFQQRRNYFQSNPNGPIDGILLSKMKYQFTHFLEKYAEEINSLPLPIKDLSRAFLDRIQEDYNERPDAEEVLKFFISLNMYYQYYKLNKAEQEKFRQDGLSSGKEKETLMKELNQMSAKHNSELTLDASVMILASKGLWKSNYYQDPIIDRDAFSKAVLALYEKKIFDNKLLTTAIFSLYQDPIVDTNELSRTILVSHENKILNDANLALDLSQLILRSHNNKFSDHAELTVGMMNLFHVPTLDKAEKHELSKAVLALYEKKILDDIKVTNELFTLYQNPAIDNKKLSAAVLELYNKNMLNDATLGMAITRLKAQQSATSSTHNTSKVSQGSPLLNGKNPAPAGSTHSSSNNTFKKS